MRPSTSHSRDFCHRNIKTCLIKKKPKIITGWETWLFESWGKSMKNRWTLMAGRQMPNHISSKALCVINQDTSHIPPTPILSLFYLSSGSKSASLTVGRPAEKGAVIWALWIRTAVSSGEISRFAPNLAWYPSRYLTLNKSGWRRPMLRDNDLTKIVRINFRCIIRSIQK